MNLAGQILVVPDYRNHLPGTQRGLPMRHRQATESMQPRRRSLTFAFAAMLLVGVMSQAPNALGDVIIFHDLTDTITVEHNGSTDVVTVSCPTTEGLGVTCSVTLTRPGASTTFGVGDDTIAEDSTLQFASDEIRGIQHFSSFDITFVSLADGTPMTCTAAFGIPCGSFETGAVQTLGNFGWTSGDPDVVQFQSEIKEAAAVPEPASALLLASACATLLPFVRRRRQRAA
jgi:hypothetical protein